MANKNTYHARYCADTMSGMVVIMPDHFDLEGDYLSPKTYKAEKSDRCGRHTGRFCRVRVDHDATGTGTAGTGDTVVRII